MSDLTSDTLNIAPSAEGLRHSSGDHHARRLETRTGRFMESRKVCGNEADIAAAIQKRLKG